MYDNTNPETHVANMNGDFGYLFNFPIGSTTWNHWGQQDPQVLEAIAQRMFDAPGVNPWVFSADARHFWQFATAEDYEFMATLTPDEHYALLGEWGDEDWDGSISV